MLNDVSVANQSTSIKNFVLSDMAKIIDSIFSPMPLHLSLSHCHFGTELYSPATTKVIMKLYWIIEKAIPSPNYLTICGNRIKFDSLLFCGCSDVLYGVMKFW